MTKLLTDKELTDLIRRQVDLVNVGSTGAAQTASEAFKAVGITANMHVGDPKESFTPRKTLEWYAGSLIDCVEKEGWYAINSWINCKDKFAPEMEN